MPEALDLSAELAAFVANARYADLPSSAVEGAKKSILDTLGVILAASGAEPSVRAVAELVRECGGREESAILGFGGRAPALMAAFANGAMAHCLDFDDHAPEGHHPSSSAVPVAFALAERVGGVSGKHLITAVAAGQDLFLRLRRNVAWKQDWHLSTVIGVLGAAAAGGHVLKLDRERLWNALGIAGVQAFGTLEMAYGVGSDLRGMYAGFISKAGALAALMAEKKVTGVKSILEGKAGMFNVFFGGKYDRAKMLEGLGRDYTGGSLLYKPWPSCGVSHTFIHATIELFKQHALDPADVVEIRVHVGDFQNQLCQPLERRRRPATPADAKFSIPYCVAVAATRGYVRVSDFTGDAIRDARVLEVAQKVVPIPDGSNWEGKLPEGRVEVVTRGGKTFERVAREVPGDAGSPLGWDALCEKFRSCASLAAVRVPDRRIREAEELVRHLEDVEDATEVMRLLS